MTLNIQTRSALPKEVAKTDLITNIETTIPIIGPRRPPIWNSAENIQVTNQVINTVKIAAMIDLPNVDLDTLAILAPIHRKKAEMITAIMPISKVPVDNTNIFTEFHLLISY